MERYVVQFVRFDLVGLSQFIVLLISCVRTMNNFKLYGYIRSLLTLWTGI